MKIKELFTIMDSEDYTNEQIKDTYYLIGRVKFLLDWEGVIVSEERIQELVMLYQINRIEPSVKLATSK